MPPDRPGPAPAELRLTPDQARRVLLEAQGLARKPRRKATKQAVLETIRRMGALQIDTIHVVARSPYLVLWSRLGAYPPEWLDELLAERKLFEYWSHEASFLPFEDYALYRHRMIDPGSLGWKYSHEWIERNHALVDRVLTAVRERGPLRSIDFERRGRSGGGWWGWKPEKRALEMLFSSGDLMVVRRDRFQRVYDLRERVIDWDDAALPPADVADRELVRKAAAALGVATTRWLKDYFRMSKPAVERAVRHLVEDGGLIPARVEGWSEAAFVEPRHLDLIDKAGAGRLRPSLTTVLSPFDPLIWDRERTLALFGFDYRLESYTPAAKRQFGYYVLPVLHRDRLVARMDAKAHRSAGRFEVVSFHVEPRTRLTDALVKAVGSAIGRLARWHATPAVRIGRKVPRRLARGLAAWANGDD